VYVPTSRIGRKFAFFHKCVRGFRMISKTKAGCLILLNSLPTGVESVRCDTGTECLCIMWRLFMYSCGECVLYIKCVSDDDSPLNSFKCFFIFKVSLTNSQGKKH
jgi:hypothetical protein